MALASAGYFCRAVVTDASGINRATRNFDIVGADLATAATNAASLITLLDAVTEGLIIGYTVGQKFEEDTATTAAAGVQVENEAVVSVNLETEGKKSTLRIPAPDPAIFLGTTGEDSNTVDSTNAALVAFVEAFTDKTGYTSPGADAIALLSDGEKVKPDNVNDKPSIRHGKRAHRASRKG